MPPAFIMEGCPGFDGQDVFGLLDGEDLSMYKMGYEGGTHDASIVLNMIKSIAPEKYAQIQHIQPCFYSMTPESEFIFEKSNKTVFAFGLSGRGFKHLTYHGKRICQLIRG